MTSSTDVQQQLRAIRQSYLASLPERFARIEHLWRQLQTTPTDKSAYAEFYRLLHSIAGSAETFGLAEIGQVARTIVLQLKHDSDITASNEISRCLEQLANLLLQASQR